MIGYVCKYTPVEVFEAMGVEIRRIQPEVTNFNQADTLMHPNICSFTKSVLEDVLHPTVPCNPDSDHRPECNISPDNSYIAVKFPDSKASDVPTKCPFH